MAQHSAAIAEFYGSTSLRVSQLTNPKYPDDIDSLFRFDAFTTAIPCWYKQIPGVNVPPVAAAGDNQ